ncbi:alpha/beta hydrolase, partial [Leptolyngbya sp. FACHB-36]|uniref:alpha/beta hydrolase n=1 Tax=Leptolyngbya sp. FACHB-36 TaxID=2692808 RepID=UPI0016800205
MAVQETRITPIQRRSSHRSSHNGCIKPLRCLLMGLVGAGVLLVAKPATSAEKLYVPFGPLNFSLSVDSLATFAETGEITPEFRFYARLLKPQLRDQFRQVLRRRFKVAPLAVAQYTYTPLGEAALQNLGQAIQTEAGVNGFHGIRSALILGAANPEGLSVVEFLRQFPTRGIRIDAQLLLNLSRQLTTYLNYRDAAVTAIEQQIATEAAAQPAAESSSLQDLTKAGPFKVAA